MERFARVILGYHGCDKPTATGLLDGSIPISSWRWSNNKYDWLGKGIYFWEHSPERALRWARAAAERRARRKGASSDIGVVGAVIQLGRCFDLTDVTFTEVLRTSFNEILRVYQSEGKSLPENEGDEPDRKRRNRDCLVLNKTLNELEEMGESFQTVRGAFEEGDAAFAGSKLRMESHIQVAVRDRTCVLGVFRPNFT